MTLFVFPNTAGEEKDVEMDDDGSSGSTDTDVDGVGEWDAEREERETWTGKMDFILSCIGYAVGLGNVWRFPYLCYRSGGGAFLVPYFFFLIVCGMPLVMLEMSIGQFCSLSPTALYHKFCPLFQGLGWAMVLVSGVVCIYYNIIITWTIYYLYLSLRAQLPWTSCGNWWNTENCVTGVGDLNLEGPNGTALGNGTGLLANLTEKNTASEEFWRNYVLQISDGVDNLVGIRLELLLCLALAWILIFACLFKGVKSSGRVVYVTATFPYCVLVILCIRGITLPGAINGIKFYLIPQWHKLAEMSVWQDAASQIFYSVGPAWGALITMSSYNRFRHNCYRDAVMIPLINCGTSVFAGIVVFSIIGFMAHESGAEVKDVITSGPGLAFIVYPEALSRLPVSPIWSCLFFVMLITIGVDTQFGMFETLISAVIDVWPAQLRPHKIAFTGAVCAGMFLLGIPFVTNGGMYILQLMDWYSATYALMTISLLECVAVVYIYGWRRYMADLELMIHGRASWWWPLCWATLTPLTILGLITTSIIKHVPVSYEDYVYPGWAVGVGWGMAAVPLLPIPIMALVAIVQADGVGFRARLAAVLSPSPDWGPSRLGDRIRFRKSFNAVPSRQTYVKGVETGEQEEFIIRALELPKDVDVRLSQEDVKFCE